MSRENLSVNWVGLEEINETRILKALQLAMSGKSVPEIARETRIPASSLYSIRKHGPYAHRKTQKRTQPQL